MVEGIFAVGIFMIISGLLLFLLNLRRYKVSLFLLGTLILVSVALLLSFSGLLLRDSTKINKNFKKICPVNLKKINQDHLNKWGCSKYM